MSKRVILLCCLFILRFQLFSQSSQQQKYALVIGVRAYQYVPPLANSLNDAKDVSSVLKKKGFNVIELYDPSNKRIMQDAVKRYFDLLRNAPDAAGLVYYSGHGMQVKGVNYLVPTQANPQMEADLEDQCVKLDYLMTALQEAGNSLNIFIMDACRNNPFRGFTRSGENGLSMVDAPKGSYIVYATKPGSVASDGTGRNGLFTSKLLQHMNTAGLNIEQVFKQVAKDVATASNDQQRPWIASDYTGDFYFTPGVTAEKSIVQGKEKAIPGTTTLTRGTPGNIALADPIADFGYGPGKTAEVTIGAQRWSASNLNVERFSNEDLIPEAKSPKEWKAAGDSGKPAWCHYNNDAANSAIYGRLYNWYAVKDPRGLCPTGWHVPSDMEWTILTDQFEADQAGNKLKGNTGWLPGEGASNESGFSGLPGGVRGIFRGFESLGAVAVWWSSTEKSGDPKVGFDRTLPGKSGAVLRNFSDKSIGFSVRCLKGEKSIESIPGKIISNDGKLVDQVLKENERFVEADFGYGPGASTAVTIGEQQWVSANLNVDRFSNGDVIPKVKDAMEWKLAADMRKPAWCNYWDIDGKESGYGKLYNWYAVVDDRGLCPSGWHVPSDAEWNMLTVHLKENAGTKLKSTDGWDDGVKGTNESGFNALPAGYRFKADGSFMNQGATALWFSSNEDDTGLIKSRYLYHKVGFMAEATHNKRQGMSVRCLKD